MFEHKMTENMKWLPPGPGPAAPPGMSVPHMKPIPIYVPSSSGYDYTEDAIIIAIVIVLTAILYRIFS